jgi:2-oxoglutarate ferredoxin oxidoreductase subunit alpha
MNNWMADAFDYPTEPINRGKVLSKEDLDKLGGFARYKDIDGDGVGYRTLPGTNHPAAAYFTRGSGHNEKAQYTERPDDYVNNMDRLVRKFEHIRQYAPKPQIISNPNAKIGIVCCGTSRYAGEEALDQLKKEYGLDASYLRLMAYPFADELKSFIEQHDRVYVIDQNRDGQLRGMMRLDLEPALLVKLRSVLHYDGMPVDARTVTDEIVKQEGI